MTFKLKSMIDFVTKTIRFMTVGMWTVDESKLTKMQVFLVNLSKIIHVTIKKFMDYRIPMQSGTCTYITAVALIPIMMVVLSALKVFGVFNDQFFNDIASKAADGSVFGPLVMLFQDALNSTAGIGGVVGLVFFVILAFTTFGTLEATFNTIWGTNRKRPIYRQLTDYMFLIIIIPVLLSAGIFLYYKVATFSIPGGIKVFLKILTIFISVWAALFMFYKIMPNAKVSVRPVMIGAIIVAFSFALLIWAVQTGVVNIGRASVDSPSIQVRILGPMAVIPVSLIFFNLLWMILLIGGILIFSIQSLHGYTGGDEFAKVSQKMRFAVVLTCVAFLVRSFYDKKTPPDVIELGKTLKVHPNFIHSAMRILASKKITGRIEGPKDVYTLMVDPAEARLIDVMDAVNEESKAFYQVKTPLVEAVGLSTIDRVQAVIRKSNVNMTLKNLAQQAKIHVVKK